MEKTLANFFFALAHVGVMATIDRIYKMMDEIEEPSEAVVEALLTEYTSATVELNQLEFVNDKPYEVIGL